MFGHKSFLRIGTFQNVGIKGLQDDGYELLNFNHSFYQDIDINGKVLTDVRGGTISILVDGYPTQELIDWGLESRRYHNGEIIVVDTNNNILEKLEFKEAACTFFKIHYTRYGSAYCAVKMEITARMMKIGSKIDVTKFWTK